MLVLLVFVRDSYALRILLIASLFHADWRWLKSYVLEES